MTTIYTKIVKDSISSLGYRITTIQVHYPRLMHADLMTHREFSRNFSGSRAIPTDTVFKGIEEDLVLPLKYLKNRSGMSGDETLKSEKVFKCINIIEKMWKDVKASVTKLDDLELHKQHKNRYLEPFQHIDGIITSTNWTNFLNLRLSKEAQPEIEELARCIKNDLAESIPIELSEDEWHLPFILDSEYNAFDVESLKKFSTARCARISYLKHGTEKISHKDDLLLYDRLYKEHHSSPFEHQARPINKKEHQLIEDLNKLIQINKLESIVNNPLYIANFFGWVSNRRELKL